MPTLLAVNEPVLLRGGKAMFQCFGWEAIEASPAADGFRTPVNGS